MKKQNRIRLSAGDRCLILLFLLCIGGIAWRVWDFRTEHAESLPEYEVTVECRNTDVRTAACLPEGEWLYTPDGEPFGKVEEILLSASKTELVQDGVRYSVEFPENTRCDMRIRIRMRGRNSGGVLLRNGTRGIAVGEFYRLYSQRTEQTYRVLFCATEPFSS